MKAKCTLLLLLIFCCSIASVAQTASDSLHIPDWVQDAVFYQIFPERFANGDPTNDPPDVEPWGGTPKIDNYFGGDLKGVIDHLDYLQHLGINAIYFNPLFESNSNHKYHTSDYLKIDDNFGDEKLFKVLLDECHRRGIKVVIDGVFNHSGTQFWAFQDIVKNETKSKYLHWYNVHSFPVSLPPNKPNYEAWWGLGELPKLMTDNPDVRNYLFDVTKYWTEMGIDGWRLDVPNEMSHDFWIAWRKLVKGINPDCYIVGEIWDDATPWLRGDQFDAVMNYRFRGASVGYIALENLNTFQFDSILTVQRSQYPANVNYVLQNLLGSHDTERFLTLCNGDVSKVKLAVLVQMTYLGAPMVYYGDEIGMEGGKDPDCRRTMVWDSTQWNTELLNWFRKMIAIRNNNPVFRRGDFSTLLVDNEKSLYAFQRKLNSQTAIVVVNNSKNPASVSLQTKTNVKVWSDLVLHRTVSGYDGSVTLSLEPRMGAILLPSE
jgi:cyclomaltodextrinase